MSDDLLLYGNRIIVPDIMKIETLGKIDPWKVTPRAPRNPEVPIMS